MTPEILIVGDPAGRRPLADAIAASGYGVALCSPRELNRLVRTTEPPAAIIACIGDLDPDMLLAGLRRTRAGASIPVILYGRLGGALRDLADVLDIGADHFIEEPVAGRESSRRPAADLEDALMQYAGPPRERGRARDDDDERGRSDRRSPPPRRDEAPARGSTSRFGTERIPDRPRPERGKALGELHRTLDRLEASLRGDDPRSDPELLAELGLDGIPDVDPPDEPLGDEELDDSVSGPMSGPLGRSVRGDDHTHPAGAAFERDRDRGRPRKGEGEDERPRPRAPRRETTAPMPRPARARPSPDEDTGPGRRSWRDDPSESSGRVDLTREWSRPDSEGPLRRDREPASAMLGPRSTPRQPTPPPPAEDPNRGRSSAVLRARRPDRDEPPRPTREPERPREPDREAARERLRELLRTGEPEHSRITGTGRFDPHARSSPWPIDDFDPSESTMIRRERGDATTRRRSLGARETPRREPEAEPSAPARLPAPASVRARGRARAGPSSADSYSCASTHASAPARRVTQLDLADRSEPARVGQARG